MAVLVEFTIYIPQADNDGRAFSREVLAGLRGRLIAVSGGLTIREGANAGHWVDDGREYIDANDEYTVALDSLRRWRRSSTSSTGRKARCGRRRFSPA